MWVFFPRAHYYSTSFASNTEAVELCESCTFNIARQRGPLGSELSPGPRQTSPNHEIIKIYHVTRPVLRLGSMLSISMDMGLSLAASLIPELCYSSSAS